MPKGDPFKKVRTGDRLRIPATTYNAFIDAALDLHARRQNATTQDTRAFRQAGIIQVKNCTGENRARFDVLGMDDPIFLPDENENSFKNRVMFDGVVPVDPDHKGKFVVLLEPLKPNAIGMACIDGVCPAWVTLPSAGGAAAARYADIADGDTTALHAGREGGGGAQILWIDPALTAGASGWAIVRLGAKANAFVYMKLTAATLISGRANAWVYSGSEVVPGQDGGWTDKPAGLTSTAIYNTFEANNSDSGVQGCGVNVDTLPTGMAIVPIGGPGAVGHPVVQAYPNQDCNGLDVYYFSGVNEVDGSCG